MKHNYNPIKLGERFGKLIVAEELKERDTNGAKRYKLVCDCGGYIIQSSSDFHKRKKQDCGCWRLEDKRKHIGEKIAGLEVLDVSKRESKDYNWYAICKCICGNVREIRYCDVKSGKNKTCGCRSIRTKSGWVRPFGRNNGCWRGYEDISGNYLTRIKKAAISRNFEFQVTPKYLWELYLKQNKKCALSGVDLIFSTNSEQTASLDRIDSSKGYIRGNVQWVHKDINNMKQDYSQDYFIDICSKITKFNKKSS